MPATKAAQDRWFEKAVGRPMNPDNAYGLQCKDVADDYCATLFGNWVNTIRPGNGKDVYNNANSHYFHKILNNPHDLHLTPQRGDIIVYGASRAVPEGHVAVVESADVHGCTVIQQDGYLQHPARRVRLTYVLPTGAATIGWLRPKLEPPKSLATPNEIAQAYLDILERPVDKDGMDHYTRYTIDFVRANLRASDEYRNLQERKAREAAAKADAEKRAAAERAEAQRIAEEQAAAERLKKQAEEQAKAVELAKKEAEEAAKLPLPPPITQQPQPTLPQPPAEPKQRHPLIIFLTALGGAILQTIKSKKE